MSLNGISDLCWPTWIGKSRTSVVFPGKWALGWMIPCSKVLRKCTQNQQLWRNKGNRNGQKEELNCMANATKVSANPTGLSGARTVLLSCTTWVKSFITHTCQSFNVGYPLERGITLGNVAPFSWGQCPDRDSPRTMTINTPVAECLSPEERDLSNTSYPLQPSTCATCIHLLYMISSGGKSWLVSFPGDAHMKDVSGTKSLQLV